MLDGVEWTRPPEVLPDRPLIEQLDMEPADAVAWLGMVGLGDPMSLARRPVELSDGQRARLRLVHALASPAEVIVCDDWLQELDPLTARAVAWRVAKACRSMGTGLIAATVRDDLARDLAPDHTLRVGWAPEPEHLRRAPAAGACSLLGEVNFSAGTHRDWCQVRQLHYAAGDAAFVAGIYKATHRPTGHLLAVAILTHPERELGARSAAFRQIMPGITRPNLMRFAQRSIRRVARIVTSPEVRGIGLGRLLIDHAHRASGAEFLEILSQQTKLSPWLLACGWREWPHPKDEAFDSLGAAVQRHNAPPHVLLDGPAFEAWADSLSKRARADVRQAVWTTYHHFVLYRRTRQRRPQRIPNPGDPRWPEAWRVACTRAEGRPRYWLSPPRPLDQH